MGHHAIMTVGAAASLAIASTGANAHSAPSIITTFGDDARASIAGASTVDMIGSVHLVRGPGAADAALDGAAPAWSPAPAHINVTLHYTPRSFRTLRTQGFYSGLGPKSRRFTQGFYSGP